MDNYGILSIIPPLVAIILAIKTRQVIISLLAGLLVGWIIISGGNPIEGFLGTIKGITDVFKSEGNTQTIIFTLFVGSLISFIQRSGGVEGFINVITDRMEKKPESSFSSMRKGTQLLAALTGLIIFVESNISALTVGAIFRPITDKLKIPREKLAYLADSTSAPSSILIPLNAWGGFIMGLLLLQGIDKPFLTLIKSIPYNLYPIITIIIVFIVISSKKDFRPMSKAEKRALVDGKVLGDNATPMMSSDITFLKTKPGIKPAFYNMIIPIAVMVFTMPVMLTYTGWDKIPDAGSQSFFNNVLDAIGQSSGAASVLYSVLTALLVSSLLYLVQRLFSVGELIDLTIKGMSGMIPLTILMVFAFSIGNLCNELGTGAYVAATTDRWLSPELIPVVIFLVSCFIAFSTGTSWGTFAIMISIAIPVAQISEVNLHLVIAAALGGGVFGDHCSPISDTTIVSSMASACDHIDHVKTQLPYALTAGVITAIIYLILGFIL